MNRRHLGFLLILAAASLAFWTPPAAMAYDYSYARVVRLSVVDGDVQVSRPDQSGWEQAQVNLPIQEGFSISTGQGRAEIEFESGATARLAENSVLQFTELALSGGGRITRLTLTQGTASFYANLTSQDTFVVLTPSVQISIPEKASFRVDTPGSSTTVSVLRGEVSVDSQAGAQRVTKGHTLAFQASSPDDVEIRRNAEADEWDRWVADREEVIHTGNTATLRYVNSPYSYGMWDLYNYGTWYNYGGYGRCWRPHGVGFGWSPFWNGRWAFYPGLGWTWISFERWGWVPYHFGSWVFAPAHGWLWVPGFFQQWHPARVTWVRVGTQTSWVPVHPHDQIGHAPANLQHGVVTTRTGWTALRPNDPHVRRQIDRGRAVEILPAPPGELGHRGQVTGNPRGSAGTPGPRPGNPPGIVYDPRDRRYVNDSSGGRREMREVEVDRGVRTPPRGFSGTVPPTPRTQTPHSPAPPAQPPAVRGPSGPTAPVAPPPPRVQTPRPPTPPPAPAPRSERPRVQSESPRPAAHWQAAPRPASPPPAPRSEPRESRGSASRRSR